ncbi:MAG: FHA domain-containing protein [Actinomycetota bacterium]|nr:FHA domain-containing protein [Actinomycetota bacterium]
MSPSCPDCGHAASPEARFCDACGTRLPDVDETTDAFEPIDELPHLADRERVPTDCGLFVVESGPKAGARYGLEADRTTVGRHGDADILLDDVTVSRRHVEVERVGDRYLVRDLGSLNGLWLNGVRIDNGELHDGDELRIGRFKLLFFHGTAV